MKFNATNIIEGLKVREIWTIALFLVLTGLIVPSFSEYMYYFNMQISKFTLLQYSILTLLSYVATLFGSIMYKCFFKRYEERNLIAFGIITENAR